ncbi:hypothetical protein D9619_008131 [Psilocybe cf. subviscida]|uniref:Hydrophobin n=1 Tax=Psilocybe cf. subviscida TaxID=2480587 RepID=A0A8H5ESG5_9AGAR|nr:hypothetical protein D9619_008131 [Psilocybe cf. subviscida]
MFKFAASFVLAIVAAQAASAQTIPVGGLCSGFAGPVRLLVHDWLAPSLMQFIQTGTCVSGSICCNVAPDLSLCAAVSSCPSSFIAPGGLCAGIAGPLPNPCYPGYKCCYSSPDNATCKKKC